MGIGGKIAIALMTIVLVVAGFFASLLALAMGSAMGLYTMAKIWLAKLRAERRFIDAEYDTVHEKTPCSGLVNRTCS